MSTASETAAAADLLYGEVEEELRATVRRLLDQRCAPSAVLARIETSEPNDRDLWRTLAGLGLVGLLVPEALGGSGPAPRECAVVMEELGRAVAPVPFLGSAVLATTALLGATDGTATAALAAMASGERIATLAIPLTTAPDAEFPTTVAVDADGRLTGRVTSVVDLEVADLAVVPVTTADGPALCLVELDAAGVTREPFVNLDHTRRTAHLTLDGVAAARIETADAAHALAHALLVGAALLASEQLGIAQWCLDTTAAYAKARYQFGRTIGSFQAVKHRLADVWVATVTARAVARAAADDLARGSDELALSAAVAQAFVSGAAVTAAEQALQLHGGIGMTWEHPVHLYLTRAKVAQLALGSPSRHRATIARLIELPAS